MGFQVYADEGILRSVNIRHSEVCPSGLWADEDERRCEVCGKLHKKRYPVGANIPIPAHPRCRCCIVPVVEDGK